MTKMGTNLQIQDTSTKTKKYVHQQFNMESSLLFNLQMLPPNI